jgi:Domain of unknown function (DUF4190)
MKQCPVCDKTFEDSMRFCQTDGTSLVDMAEEPELDPFKTMVAAPKEDLDAAIPPPADDPFKTVVAGSEAKNESGDLLQLPEEEYDPLKTSVVSAGDLPEIAPEEIIDAAPPSPFGESPEPPKFEEPSLSPPDFSDPPRQDDPGFTESATEIIPPDSMPKFDTPAPEDFTPQPPIPSPFGDSPASYEKPSTPPYQEPEPQPYPEPEPPPTVMGANPFDQPPPQPEQFNQPFQQNEWTPPPAPVSNWQDQGLGANTPFQPPAATQGLNQTLPIISLVFGILSVCCYVSPLTGIVAVITGFLGMKNANNDPNQYGGKGLAIAGMICGGLFLLLGIVYWILIFIGVAAGNFRNF